MCAGGGCCRGGGGGEREEEEEEEEEEGQEVKGEEGLRGDLFFGSSVHDQLDQTYKSIAHYYSVY